MPIYEYACQACGHRFEKLMRISADPPPCPECEGDVKKLVSASAFVLKGGGWYKDHYGLKKSAGSSAGGSGEGGASKASSGDSGSTSSSTSSGDSTSKAVK